MTVRGRLILWVCWGLLLGGALAVDQPLKAWLHERDFHVTGEVFRRTPVANLLKFPGHFVCALLVAAALVWGLKQPLRRGTLLVGCAAMAVLSDPIKWLVGRHRPVTDDGDLTPWLWFDPCNGGLIGLFHPSGASFPSGHTMLAFAVATCLGRYYPRRKGLFFVIASVVAVERVLEVAHHASDVVATAALAILMTHVLMNLVDGSALGGEITLTQVEVEDKSELEHARALSVAGDSSVQRARDNSCAA